MGARLTRRRERRAGGREPAEPVVHPGWRFVRPGRRAPAVGALDLDTDNELEAVVDVDRSSLPPAYSQSAPSRLPPPMYSAGDEPANFTVEDCCSWLEEHGLDAACSSFRAHHVDGTVMLALDHWLVDGSLENLLGIRDLELTEQLLRHCNALVPSSRTDHQVLQLGLQQSGKISEEALMLDCRNHQPPITPNQIRSIASAATRSRLRWVNLKGCGVDHRSLGPLIAALSPAVGTLSSTGLSTLILDGNNLDDAAVGALAEVLQTGRSPLRELSLDQNDIMHNGAKALGLVLIKSNRLRTLSLYWNDLGDSGGLWLARALARNQGLQAIDLGCCGLGERSAKAISHAIAHNCSLQTIKLAGNDFRAVGGLQVAQALKENATLRGLDLRDNRLGGSTVAALTEAWKASPAALEIDSV